MKIMHISDTHGFHGLLEESLFEGVDVLVHSGDATNFKEVFRNLPEMEAFIDWYARIPVKHKIYVAGNHDSAIYNGVFNKAIFEQSGIIYLELNEVVIDGVKFYGSPYTPLFGDWFYMKKRGKLQPIYNTIPVDTEVLISHGPPWGILDLSYDMNGKLEFCGCKELRNAIKIVQPKLVLFGHIHSNEDIINHGTRIIDDITYSNASVVTDNKFGKLSSTGNIFNI